MLIKERISIKEFDNKHYQIKLIEPLEEGRAILTHYLHNIRNGVSKHYKSEALSIIKNYVEYKNDNKGSIVEEETIQQLLFEVENVPFPTPKNYNFKFIELFAGIGGFRIAMQNVGGKCVYTSEWDKDAKTTYRENFGEVPFGDITKEKVKKFFPEKFDVLCVGLKKQTKRVFYF